MTVRLLWPCMLLASMTACVGAVENEETSMEEPTATTDTSTAALSSYGDEGVGPLDHPVPVLDFPTRHLPAPPDLDLFTEAWERNPLSRGCYVSYVTIYDPAKGKKIELPITLCE